jgi:hypothetical protein
MALGSTQPLTEMSTRNLPGGKGRPADRPARKADITAICEPTVYKENVGASMSHNPMGLHGFTLRPLYQGEIKFCACYIEAWVVPYAVENIKICPGQTAWLVQPVAQSVTILTELSCFMVLLPIQTQSTVTHTRVNIFMCFSLSALTVGPFQTSTLPGDRENLPKDTTKAKRET